jgi:hypothetical protein
LALSGTIRKIKKILTFRTMEVLVTPHREKMPAFYPSVVQFSASPSHFLLQAMDCETGLISML